MPKATYFTSVSLALVGLAEGGGLPSFMLDGAVPAPCQSEQARQRLYLPRRQCGFKLLLLEQWPLVSWLFDPGDLSPGPTVVARVSVPMLEMLAMPCMPPPPPSGVRLGLPFIAQLP